MNWADAWTGIAADISLGGLLAAGAIGLAAWWVLSTEWDRVPRIAVHLDPGVGHSVSVIPRLAQLPAFLWACM